MSQTPTLPPEPAHQPIRFKRDQDTGLVVGHVYRYTADGRIDWRAEVPTRFLYVAKEKEAKVVVRLGKPIAELTEDDLRGLPDDWLRIRVGGLNYIAQLRGVRSCTYPTLQTREGFAAAVCEIEFAPNAESDMMPETWSAIASACRASMDVKMLPYLETFAENRSFGRTVKRALQINIVSDIEVGGDAREAATAADEGVQEAAVAASSPSGFEAWNELEQVCRNHRDAKGTASPISFEALRAAAVKMNADNPASSDPTKPAERTQADPATWKGFSDIQPIDAWLLLGRIRQKEAAAKAAPETKTGKPKSGGKTS